MQNEYKKNGDFIIYMLSNVDKFPYNNKMKYNLLE
jgi:hypothetical protein